MRLRTPTLFLVASVAVNAGLVALVLFKAPFVFQAASYGAATPTPAVAIPQASPAASIPAFLASLDKGDMKTLADRLRAAGASRELTRALLFERANMLLYERKKDLAAQLVPQPYWSHKFGRLDPKFLSAMNAIYKEQGDMVNALMGPDPGNPNDDPLNGALMANQRGGVPQADSDRVQSIENDYNQMKNDLAMKNSGAWLPDDTARMAYLEGEEKKDLRSALSPERYLEYQMRNSPTASSLRDSMQVFGPTEGEFRAVFKAQADFDEQYGPQFGVTTPEQREAREAHQSDLAASIESALGPDRYAQYKVESDLSYINTTNLVDRMGLPPATTQQITAVQSDITKRADGIQNDATLSAAEKARQLAALGEEANTKITAALGSDGMSVYKQSAGWWLDRLKPSTK
ncbi:MAG TPA: hypothetical protein VFE25_02565 [Opitutaceae bacterium]|nr:hypothetical protein [Opitutaceae bacterium]